MGIILWLFISFFVMIVSLIIFSSPGIGIGIFISGAILFQGLKKVQTDPPTVGAKTRFGRRTGKFVKEGWHFFLFYPFMNGYIPIHVTKINLDLEGQKIRTPDLAELEVPVSITFTPDQDNPINYLNSGGEEGVKTIITDIIKESLREWAIAADEGPRNYREAMASQEEGTAILLKAIIHDQLMPVNSKVPTPILLRYFNVPQRKPTESQTKDWGENWEKVKEMIEKECAIPENLEALKERVETRRKEIKEVRQGKGKNKKPDLGIILNRLNLGEIKPIGELAKAMELEVKEERDKAGEAMANKNFLDRLGELIGVGFTKEQAAEIIQTVIIGDCKVTKEIREIKLNVSPETREMIEKIGPSVIQKIFGR